MSDSDDIDRLILELNSSVQPVRAAVRLETAAGSSAGWGRWPAATAATCCSSPVRRRRSASTARSPARRGAARRREIEEAVLPAFRRTPGGSIARHGIADGSFRAARPLPRQPAPRTRPAAAAIRRCRLASARSRRSAARRQSSLTRLPRGLVLIGGPTGSGKTTTLAALVDEINRRDARHIVTIEDPIEYEHRTRAASSSRSRSASTRRTSRPRCAPRCARRRTSSSSARCATPRRCASRWRAARRATWCSRPSTRPTSRRPSSRVADSFPPERQNTIRQELAMALAAVLTQTLLPQHGRRPHRRRPSC